MRGAVAALMALAGAALADPGHGAVEGHFHWLGVEHAVLFAAMFLLVVFALRK